MTEKTFTQSEVDAFVQTRVAAVKRRLAPDLQVAVERLTAERDQARADVERLRAELDNLWPRPRPRLSTWLTTWIRR